MKKGGTIHKRRNKALLQGTQKTQENVQTGYELPSKCISNLIPPDTWTARRLRSAKAIIFQI